MIDAPDQAVGIFSFFIALAAFSITVGMYGRKKKYLYVFFLGYLCLAAGLLAANFSNFIFYDILSPISHILGIMLPGLFFLITAVRVAMVK